MWGYLIKRNSNGRIITLRDNDDDGEDNAGKNIAELLENMVGRNANPESGSTVGVLLIVTRWYGGIKLGPKRFAHIKNVGREVLVAMGF